MTTEKLHQNFLLLTAFLSDEPIKCWVVEDETYTSNFHKSWDTLAPVVKQISIAALLEQKISPRAYEMFAIHLQTAHLADDVAAAYALCVRIVEYIRNKFPADQEA